VLAQEPVPFAKGQEELKACACTGAQVLPMSAPGPSGAAAGDLSRGPGGGQPQVSNVPDRETALQALEVSAACARQVDSTASPPSKGQMCQTSTQHFKPSK